MEIVLSQGGARVSFPVLPSEYSISSSQGNTVVNINAIGEVNLLGKENLDTISFSGIFPKRTDSFVSQLTDTPKGYIETLLTMKMAGPCQLHLLDILAMHCTIESLDWGENDRTGDINFSIQLKKYIYINSEGIATVNALKGAGREAPAKPRNGRTYTVKAGDNLFMIARRELNTTNWAILYQINRTVIGNDPNVLKPGTKLILPA